MVDHGLNERKGDIKPDQIIQIPEMVLGRIKEIIQRVAHRILIEEQLVPNQIKAAPCDKHTDIMKDLLAILIRIIWLSQRQIAGNHEKQRDSDPGCRIDEDQRDEFL